MPVFIELVTDAFEENLSRIEGKYATGEHAGLSNVRRPLRGLEIKEDTYAAIKVIRADGSEVPLIDSSHPSGRRKKTASFILQSVQEVRLEKHQIVETFGEPYVFFFGEAPRFLDVTAVLLNSFDFNWEAEFWENWNRYLRGTKSVELGARTYLFFDDSVVEGYLLMAQAQKVSEQPLMVQLSWRMFVTGHRNVSSIGEPQFPVHASVNLPPNVTLTNADAFSALTESFEDSARAAEESAAFDDEINRLSRQPFGSRGRLSDELRRARRSVAFAPDVQSLVDSLRASNAQDLPELDVLDRLESRPLRSRIADNADEFTGSGNIAPSPSALPEVWDPRIRTTEEAQDLFFDAIGWMNVFGANIDSYQTLSELGLGVRFSERGVALGGGQSSLSASFAPATGPKARAVASARATVGAELSLETGFGDPVYGYASPFGGPGFGQVGYGDLGGPAYGSGFGPTGDPGYRSPDEFTFAGVEDERDAFQRFIRPRPGFGSGLGGIGAGDSFAGSGFGAAVVVDGKVSAFAIVAVEGTLDPTGQATSDGDIDIAAFRLSELV